MGRASSIAAVAAALRSREGAPARDGPHRTAVKGRRCGRGDGWIGADDGRELDTRAVDDVLTSLRAARWHRRDADREIHAHRTLAVDGGTSTHSIAIGDKLAGTEQAWIRVDGGPALLVDGWLANLLDPGPLAFRDRAPLAAAATLDDHDRAGGHDARARTATRGARATAWSHPRSATHSRPRSPGSCSSVPRRRAPARRSRRSRSRPVAHVQIGGACAQPDQIAIVRRRGRRVHRGVRVDRGARRDRGARASRRRHRRSPPCGLRDRSRRPRRRDAVARPPPDARVRERRDEPRGSGSRRGARARARRARANRSRCPRPHPRSRSRSRRSAATRSRSTCSPTRCIAAARPSRSRITRRRARDPRSPRERAARYRALGRGAVDDHARSCSTASRIAAAPCSASGRAAGRPARSDTRRSGRRADAKLARAGPHRHGRDAASPPDHVRAAGRRPVTRELALGAPAPTDVRQCSTPSPSPRRSSCAPRSRRWRADCSTSPRDARSGSRGRLFSPRAATSPKPATSLRPAIPEQRARHLSAATGEHAAPGDPRRSTAAVGPRASTGAA